MAYNGAGIFSRLYSWVTDRNNAVKIEAERMDDEFDGIADALSLCLLKDGQQTPTAHIPMGGFKLTGLGDATNATDALNRQAADARYISTGALGDPNADRILFWDDSEGAIAYLTASTGLTVTTTNLTVNTASTSVVGITELATAAEYRSKATGNLSLTPEQVWDAAAEVALTDAATIALDLSTGINFSVTLGGNRALGNASNGKVGQSGHIRAVQDGGGSRTLSYGTDYEFAGGAAVVLSTTGADQDLLFYKVLASGRIFISAAKDIS